MSMLVYSRREWIKTAGAVLCLSPLAGPLHAEPSKSDALRREATWDEIVTFFNTLPHVETAWQGESRHIRQEFILRIPFEGEDGVELEGLAGKFVRSRYNRGGELLWYFLHIDESISERAPWTASGSNVVPR